MKIVDNLRVLIRCSNCGSILEKIIVHSDEIDSIIYPIVCEEKIYCPYCDKNLLYQLVVEIAK